MRILIAFLALFVFLPAHSSAHGSGTPFDADVGDYRFEIGASTVGVRPGEETEFHFELFHKNADGNLEYVRFEKMTVNIAESGSEIHSEDIAPVPGNTNELAFTFPRAGTYAMTVSYEAAGKPIAETTVAIPVAKNAGMLGRIITYIETGGVILVVIIAAGMSAWQYVPDRRRD